MKKFITAFYIFMLSIGAAVIFLLGAFVAPTIFHTETFNGVPLLSHYDAGLLMSHIFSKANYLLLITMITIAFYDGMRIYKRKSNTLMAVFAGFSVFGLALHLFFFTPKIIEFQEAGEFATKSETFAMIHKLSETDFKMVLFCLISLAMMRLTSSLKDDCCSDKES